MDTSLLYPIDDSYIHIKVMERELTQLYFFEGAGHPGDALEIKDNRFVKADAAEGLQMIAVPDHRSLSSSFKIEYKCINCADSRSIS